MKYFLLAFLLAVVTVVIVAGPRGRHSTNRPFEFFPDMVRQDKVKPQQPSSFFADGLGPRKPVDGTVPIGYEVPRETVASHLAPAASPGALMPASTIPAFTAGPGYYDTGKMGDQWGTGLPIEVTPTVMARGQQRFTINCAVCHGATGSGNGVTSKYGLAGIANYHDDKYVKMADGEIFNTITNGHNTMMGYGSNVAVADRWAIIAYIRALQRLEMVKLDELSPAQKQDILNSK